MRITEYYIRIKQTNPDKSIEEILEDVVNIQHIKEEYKRKERFHVAELNEMTERLSRALNNEYEMSKQLDYMAKRNEELKKELDSICQRKEENQ